MTPSVITQSHAGFRGTQPNRGGGIGGILVAETSASSLDRSTSKVRESDKPNSAGFVGNVGGDITHIICRP